MVAGVKAGLPSGKKHSHCQGLGSQTDSLQSHFQLEISSFKIKIPSYQWDFNSAGLEIFVLSEITL